MQAQIKVQNQEKCLEWWLFFLFQVYRIWKKTQSFIYRGHSLRLFLFPISYKDEGLKQWCGYHQLYLQCLIRTLVTFSQHSNKTLCRH